MWDLGSLTKDQTQAHPAMKVPSPNHWTAREFPKWAKNLNRHFSKEDTQVVDKHKTRCFTLVIVERQIKTTMR